MGVRRATPGLTSTAAWVEANRIACEDIADPNIAACPLAPTNWYYYNKYHNDVKQLAFFGEMTYNLTDKWSVTGGARWFEYDRNSFDQYQVPRGLPASSDPEANGLTSQGTDSDTTFKFATEYHFNPDVMVYALYSEGFRLGGENSQRAADTGLVPATYGPDLLKNYEAGIKSEWFDHRLQLNLSAFLMDWEDIQIRVTSTTLSDSGAFWIEGNFNAAMPSRRASSSAASGWRRTGSTSSGAYFSEVPSSRTMCPTRIRPRARFSSARAGRCRSRRRRSTGPRSNTRSPDFLPQGDLWTSFAYSYQGKVWDSLTAIRDNNSDDPADVADSQDFLIPEWTSGTFQVGFTGDNGWSSTLIVRNVFDDDSYSYLSSSSYGDIFGDPRMRHIRNLQRPISYYLNFTKKW